MSEDGDTNTEPSADSGAAATSGQTFTQADVDRIVADRLSRERDKITRKYGDYDQLKAAAADLEQLRQSAMTEQEKAVAEAEKRGRDTALADASRRLAAAEFRAYAATRMDDDAIAGALELLDLTKLVDRKGDPDTAAIKAAVDRLAGAARTPNYDGGARANAESTDMNTWIRQRAGMS